MGQPRKRADKSGGPVHVGEFAAMGGKADTADFDSETPARMLELLRQQGNGEKMAFL
jgi:hypothetical protein